jgi:hypothetical protein
MEKQKREEILDSVSIHSATIEADRIRQLVADVYLRLPFRARQKAMEKIRFWLLADAVFPEHLYFPVPAKVSAVEATFIVIPGDILKWSNSRLRTTIAHEIAHVLLTKRGRVPGHGKGAQDELAADDLCENWGFGRVYTERQIKKMLSLQRRIQRI